MLIATLFTTAKTKKQSNCPLMDEGIKKMWYIHAIKHYSGIAKKEILLLVTPLIILKDIMISGKARHRKANTI